MTQDSAVTSDTEGASAWNTPVLDFWYMETTQGESGQETPRASHSALQHFSGLMGAAAAPLWPCLRDTHSRALGWVSG